MKLLNPLLIMLVLICTCYELRSQSVNTVSGRLENSIKVMEVPGPNGSYPINFNYDAGVKPNQQSSWIGLGWNFGPGAIYRQLNNIPDDWSNVETKASSFVTHNPRYKKVFKEQLRDAIDYINSPQYIIDNLTFDPPSLDEGGGLSSGVNIDYPDLPDNISENSNKLVKNRNYGSLKFHDFYANELNNLSEITQPFQTLDADSNTVGAVNLDVKRLIRHAKGTSEFDNFSKEGGLIPAFDNYINTTPGIGGQFSPFYASDVTLGDRDTDEGYHLYSADMRFKYIKKSDPTSTLNTASGVEFRYNGSSSNYLVYEEDVNIYAYSVSNNGEVDTDDSYSALSNGKLHDSKNIKWFTNQQIANVESNPTNNPHGMMIHPLNYSSLSQQCSNNDDSRTKLCVNVEDYLVFNNDYSDYTDPCCWGVPPQVIYKRENGGFTTIKSGNEEFDISDQIGGFVITDENGFKYHYTLPVYQYGTFNHNSSKLSDRFEGFVEMQRPFAYKWELFAITGPNFKDLNNDLIPNEGDWGYWVRFDYGLWSRDYTERSPDIGFTDEYGRINEKDGSYQLSKKEIYYLNSITTATHTALFVKEIRKDKKGIASYKNYNLTNFIAYDSWLNHPLHPYFDKDMGYRYKDVFNFSQRNLLNWDDMHLLYYPQMHKPKNHVHPSLPTPIQYSSWPVSSCGLNRIILIANDNLDEYLTNKGFMENGEPSLKKLYNRSKIVNDVVRLQSNGAKSTFHLGSNILDVHDVFGLESDFSTVNFDNGQESVVTISKNLLTPASNGLIDKCVVNVKLGHNYELSKNSLRSFDMDYNHYSARGNFVGNGFLFNSILSDFDYGIEYPYSSLEYDGKYTLKNIKFFDYEGNRISKLGSFFYDYDSLRLDQNSNHLSQLNTGYFTHNNDIISINNVTHPELLDKGDIIKVYRSFVDIWYYLYIHESNGNVFQGKVFDYLLGDNSTGYTSLSNGVFNFYKTNNPPSNNASSISQLNSLNNFNNYGDYLPTVSTTSSSDQNRNNLFSNEISGKSASAWSLLGYQNDDGSIIRFDYELNSFDNTVETPEKILNTDNVSTLSISGSSAVNSSYRIDLMYNDIDNLNKYLVNDFGDHLDIVFVLRYDPSVVCGPEHELDEQNPTYKEEGYYYYSIEFNDIEYSIINNNKLRLYSQDIWRTLKNDGLSTSGNVYYPDDLIDVQHLCKCNAQNPSCFPSLDYGDILFNTEPEILSSTIMFGEKVSSKYGRGLRVKSLEIDDGIINRSLRYTYTDDDNSTSGKVLVDMGFKPNIPINNTQWSTIPDNPNFFKYLKEYYAALNYVSTSFNNLGVYKYLMPDRGVVYSRIKEESFTNDNPTFFSKEFSNFNYKKNRDFGIDYNLVEFNNNYFNSTYINAFPVAGLPRKSTEFFKDNKLNSSEFTYDFNKRFSAKKIIDTKLSNNDRQSVFDRFYFEKQVDSKTNQDQSNRFVKMRTAVPFLKSVKQTNKFGMYTTQEFLEYNIETGNSSKIRTISSKGKSQITVAEPAHQLLNSSGGSLYSNLKSNFNSLGNKNQLTLPGSMHSYFENSNGQNIGDIEKTYYGYENDAKIVLEDGTIINSSNYGNFLLPYSQFASMHEFQSNSTKNDNGTYSIPGVSPPANISSVKNLEFGLSTGKITLRDIYFRSLESNSSTNPEMYSSVKYGYNGKYIICSASNAKYNEIAFSGAEHFMDNQNYFDGLVDKGDGTQYQLVSHTGDYNLLVGAEKEGFKFKTKLDRPNTFVISVWTTAQNTEQTEIKIKVGQIEEANEDPQGRIASGSSGGGSSGGYIETGGEITILDGSWNLLKYIFEYDGNYQDVEFMVSNISDGFIRYDDFRVHPVNSNFESFVYDQTDGSLEAMLDKENFYTRSELEIDGNSAIVKTFTETLNGEKLIQEKSSTLKNRDR